MLKNCRKVLLIISGVMCIVSAVLLTLFNLNENVKGGEISQNIVDDFKEKVSESSDIYEPDSEYGNLFEKYEQYGQYEQTESEENESEQEYIMAYGEECCGIIKIPAIGIELPVLARLNAENLKKAPCIYSGSTENRNLIVAAHNYNTHFGKINTLVCGDIITFTDIHGNETQFEVIQLDTISGDDTLNMLKEGDWNMTLFTCTLSGVNRVTVRAAVI